MKAYLERMTYFKKTTSASSWIDEDKAVSLWPKIWTWDSLNMKHEDLPLEKMFDFSFPEQINRSKDGDKLTTIN